MSSEQLAALLRDNPHITVSVFNRADEIAMHARCLLYALDRGFLNYKPDTPESAFVSELRVALAKSEER